MKAQDCPKFGPLQGVKVVNLTMAIAGPFACSLLADLGAEVIGVESPRGRDTSRPTNQALQGWGTQMERRNTRSLCMNVKDGAGRAWFFELLKQADILVDGFRGGQMAKWGMTDEALWEVNPKLTIAHISGFGQTGDPAYVSRASFDGIGQAYGCFMEMNGYPDRLPVLAFPQVSDYYAGFMASIGALAGYINAQRTGKGDSVDVAQYEAMLRCEGFYALNYLNTGALPVREGSHSTSSAGYGTYICQDGVPIYTLILGPGVVRAALPLFGLEYGSELFPEGTPVISFGSEAGNVLEEAMEAFFGSHTAEEAERLMLEAVFRAPRAGARRAVQPHLHLRDGGARPALPGARKLHRVEELLRRRVDPRRERGAAHEEQPGADLARHAAGRRRQRGHPRRAGRHARRCCQPLRRTAPQEGERPLRLNGTRRRGGVDVSSPVPSLFRAADRMRH